MKNLIAFLAFVMMSQAQAQAPAQVQVVQASPQQSIVAQAPAEAPRKTLIYDERTNQLVEVAPQVQQQQAAPVQAEASATNGGQPIYILNNQKLQGYQGAIQEAPVSVVQDAPARVSASSTLRKERQGQEAATEDGIVQTLEKARLEDEVRRRDKFNNALNSTTATAPTISGTSQAASASSIVNAPNANNVITTTTAATVEENEVIEIPQKKTSKRKKIILEDETSENDRPDVKAEVRAALAEQNAAPLNLTSYYVSGLVGTAKYNDATNIRGKLASGLAIGMVTPERFIVEGSFMYGQFQVDDIAGPMATYTTLDMNQYNWSVAGKYQILPGKLRPTVGAIASYTRRNYSFAGYSNGDSLLTTDAFDAGLEAGLDLALTNNFSIGADFRYLWNIASKNDSQQNTRNGYYYPNYGSGYNSNYGGFKVVEDLSYYLATLSAKFTF